VEWLTHFFGVCAFLGASEFGKVFWERYARYLLQPNIDVVHVLYTLVPMADPELEVLDYNGRVAGYLVDVAIVQENRRRGSHDKEVRLATIQCRISHPLFRQQGYHGFLMSQVETYLANEYNV
jgi:hypothetical protein